MAREKKIHNEFDKVYEYIMHELQIMNFWTKKNFITKRYFLVFISQNMAVVARKL